MTRRQVAAALAAVVLAACSRKTAHEEPIRQHADESGAEAHRVVSVSPATTEALFAVGAGDRLVGRSRFDDWPPEATKVPAVGGVIDADFEAILGLAPDLVVGSPGPASTRLADKLAGFHIATWFPPMDTLAQVEAMIVEMGDRTGHGPDGRRVAATLETHLARVEASVASEPPPRVLMVVDVSPVVAAGPRDFIDEMLRRAGGANVLTAGGPWQTLDFEQIVDLDPDVVLDVSMLGTPGPTRITPEVHGWSEVRAVREGHVVPLADPRVLRPGPRIDEGLAVLARALHPRAAVPSW
jgi:iron complex transport system substrate-binding protein